jgi:hypothetical protein
MWVRFWSEATRHRALQVWHEKWGEDYSKEGDSCVKYTDRWSETQLPDGRYVKGGDKWREGFGEGSGSKTGETWHEDADGSRCAPPSPSPVCAHGHAPEVAQCRRFSYTLLELGVEHVGRGRLRLTSASARACRWSRTWGENHHGGGWVQKWGHSTSGEAWDYTEQSGTYYNPKPHFTFDMALAHSPDLLTIPERARESTPEEFMAGGMDDF